MTKRKILTRTKQRRLITWLASVVLLASIGYLVNIAITQIYHEQKQVAVEQAASGTALAALNKLPVKESESGDNYERSEFSSGWASWRDCNVRQKILNRDLQNIQLGDNGCTVVSGTLNDPYSGQTIELKTKSAVSSKVQIDHVVALSNAWQTGAQYLTKEERKALANDDLELIAVSSSANQEKSDGDASEWLPPNRAFQCEYVARQIAVKYKYHLWVTEPEHAAMITVLAACPTQTVTGINVNQFER